MAKVGRFGLSLLCLLGTLAPAVADAESVRDEATGLQVDPPSGYTARAVPPGTGQAAKFLVKTEADTDTGCNVAYSPAPQNNRLSQAEINATIRTEKWQEAARTALSRGYVIRSTTPFKSGDREGVAISADFRSAPGQPPRAALVRTLFVIQETPRGRTSTVCVGERAGFDDRQKEFLAVAAGASPP